jgi:TIR domain-containing protein
VKVFISWSGSRSQSVAHALRDWLPDVLQTVEPFLSSADIEAGQRWSQQLAAQLEQTSFGLVCVTSDNQEAAWLNFEAGALAKALGASTVIPLLDDLRPTDLTGPLSQFQAKSLDREGLTDVITAINDAMTAPLTADRLGRAIERSWPELEQRLEHLRTRPPQHSARRSERDLLEEILTRVRDLGHSPSSSSPSEPSTAAVSRRAGMRIASEFPEARVRRVKEGLVVELPPPVSPEVVARVHEIAENNGATVRVAVPVRPAE